MSEKKEYRELKIEAHTELWGKVRLSLESKEVKNAFESFFCDESAYDELYSSLAYKEAHSAEDVYNSPLIKVLYKYSSEKSKKLFDAYVSACPVWGGYHYSDFRSYRSENRYGKIDTFIFLLVTLYTHEYMGRDMLGYLKGEKCTFNGEQIEIDDGYWGGIDIAEITAILCVQGENEVYNYIKNMVYNNENLVNFSPSIVQALIRSPIEGSNQVVMDLLKAAKLSEGLRSCIVERIDIGTIETFKYFLQYIRDEKLIRFSSVKRAFLTYTGLGDSEKMLELSEDVAGYIFESLLDNKIEEYLTSENPLKVYVALYAMACNDVNKTIAHCKENIGKVSHQVLSAYKTFLVRTKTPISIDVVCDILENTDDVSVFLCMTDVEVASINEVSEEQKRRFINLVCSKIQDLKVKDSKQILVDGSYGAALYRHGYYLLAFYFAHQINDMYEQVYESFEKFYSEYSNYLYTKAPKGYGGEYTLLSTKIAERFDNAYVRKSVIASLSKNNRDIAFKIVKSQYGSLTKDDYLLITQGFKSKRSEVRQNINTLLALASTDIILECAKTLLLDKNVEMRNGAISLLTETFNKVRDTEGFLQIKEDLENAQLPTEVSQVRDKLLSKEVQTTQEWFFDTNYTLDIPQFVPLSKAEKEHCKNVFLSAVNKINGEKAKKVSIKEIEKCIQKVVSIFESHIGEDVGFYAYTYDEKKTIGKVGYDFALTTRCEYMGEKLKEVPFYDEYMELSKDLTNEEINTLWIFVQCISERFSWSFYTDDAIRFYITSTIFESVFDFDFYPLHNSTNEDHVKHFIQRILLLKNARIQNQDFLHDSAVQEILLCVLQQYIEYKYELISSKGEVIAKNIIIAAKKIGENTRWDTDSDNMDTVVSRDHFYFIQNLFTDDIKTVHNTNKSDVLLMNIVHIAELQKDSFSGHTFKGLLKKIHEGSVKEDIFYKDVLINHSNDTYQKLYYATIVERSELDKDLLPTAKKIYDTISFKIIDIELERSESVTPFSDMVENKCVVESSSIFLKTVYKLGKMPFTRGYSWTTGNPIKDVFSSLISKTRVENDFSQEAYNALIKEYKISEQRLLEASMYNLAFMPYTEKYLGIEGLTKAAYYFRAHMNEVFDDTTTKIVRRYSDVDTKDFQEGQMDLDWFRETYAELGEENFSKLYDAAKYITDGGKHKRAQYFADAVLGKLKLEDVEARINDKRNQEMILAYGLIPFANDKLKDALSRYKKLQAFLKESKQFGAQRKASEALKVSIAMNNLARNYGFKDAARFSWNMETELYQEMVQFFTPFAIEDIEVYISIEDTEKPRIVAIKEGKELKALPSKYNKHEYIVELKEAQKDLRNQFKRARTTLENVMIFEDNLTLEELQGLQKHPIISSLLKNLLFASSNAVGMLDGTKLVNHDKTEVNVNSSDTLSIVHPIVLLQQGSWAAWQEYFISQNIVQPFKQVFREVYTLTEDEKKENGITYRFAGYQIEKNKAMGVLKTRGWLISENQGFEKVNHKDNIRIELYSYADWFMPSEIESPSIEKIEFRNNKTDKKVDLATISPVLYSETMRDMDLVVSVAYVGGVDPMLNQSTIDMRKRILAHNLELFGITNYTFDANHIMISGSLNDYSLHLGSAIIHTKNKGMLPVFPVHSQQRGQIFLPFIDSDPKTSEIISKVLMLAEDNKIKDPTVLIHLK